MANIRCNGISNVSGPIVDLNGLTDNSPALNSFGFLYGTTPGGPYPNATPHTTVGNNTVNQAFDETISGLDPATTYYFVAVEYLANIIILTSSECSFAMIGASRLFDCDPPCAANIAIPIPGVIPPCIPVCVP